MLSLSVDAQRGKISVSAYHTLLNYKYEDAMPSTARWFQIDKGTSHTYTTGVEFNFALSRALSVSSGLEYSHVSLRGTEFSVSSLWLGPGGSEAHLKLLSLPLNVRAFFWRYVFAEFNALFNISQGGDKSITHEISPRFRYGIGAKYDINPFISVFALPYRQTTLQMYPKSPDPLFDGLNLGLKFTFAKSSVVK